MTEGDGVQPIRSRISGFLFGAGLTGFFGRGMVELTLWFGTARTWPRPDERLLYPVVEHGKTYYVSAAEYLLHTIILGFWVVFMLGLLLRPSRRGSDRTRRLYDPRGIFVRWYWFGTGASLAFMAACHVFATAMMGPR